MQAHHRAYILVGPGHAAVFLDTFQIDSLAIALLERPHSTQKRTPSLQAVALKGVGEILQKKGVYSTEQHLQAHQGKEQGEKAPQHQHRQAVRQGGPQGGEQHAAQDDAGKGRAVHKAQAVGR